MLKFKTGEKCWYFVAEGDTPIRVEWIDLMCSPIFNKDDADTINASEEGIYFRNRRKALEALSAHLKYLLDDEENE